MKNLRLLALCLAFCLLAAACGKKTETQSEETKPAEVSTETGGANTPDASTLVVAVADEIEGLDVQQIGYANIVHSLVTEPLITYSTDLTEIYPAFAESFTITDSYIEFVLPEDAKFSNGDAVDAAAVKASTERFLEVSEYAGDLDTLTSVEAVDARTVRYHISAAAPYSLATISSMFGAVVDVAEAERVGEWEFNRRPVMNGPYRVEEWVAGSHLTLVRNEYFHTNNPSIKNHGAANFERIVVRFVPDGAERLRLLEAGEVDIVYNAPTTEWARLASDSSYNVWSYQQPGVCYLNLQTGKGVLEDIKVREALTCAVDRDAIVSALGGVVTASYGFLAAPQTGYSAAEEAKLAEMLRFDPERSRALLAEAGWADADGDGILDKNGKKLSFEMLIPGDRGSFSRVGEILVGQFAAVGAEARMLLLEADYIKELMSSDEYEIGSRAYEWNDADILYWAFTGDAGYCWDDPELTALLTQARHTNDYEERVRLYAEASDILAADFKGISLFSDNYIIVSRSNVKGLVAALDDRSWLNDVTKE